MTEGWVNGWTSVAFVYMLCFLLSRLVPSREVDGYVLDRSTRRPLRYKLSGFSVLVLVVLAAVGAVAAGVLPGNLFVVQYWACVSAAFIYGVLLSLGMYVRGRRLLAQGAVDRLPLASTVTAPTWPRGEGDTGEFDARGTIATLYCGHEWNPRVWGVDVKMWLYLVGAVQLELVLLSALYTHVSLRAEAGLPSASWPMLSYCGCLSWFVFEYMHYEEVHLYTYDLFRERLGGKLVWGCLCFYPFFYEVGVWGLTGGVGDKDKGFDIAFLSSSVFFFGWSLTRGANLQKHAFRVHPERTHFTFLGMTVRQTTIQREGVGRLLCGGWWALSRHINYCGEIVQGVGLALPGALATGSLYPWLYPLYYVLLFVPRQWDDDRICAAKYGEVWGEYVRRVPYRIVPGLY
jgi:delta14-sterol reductase